jgi:hypothetical protein
MLRGWHITLDIMQKKEKKLIDNLTLSPSVLSLYILWGMFNTMDENVKYLNKQLNLFNALKHLC